MFSYDNGKTYDLSGKITIAEVINKIRFEKSEVQLFADISKTIIDSPNPKKDFVRGGNLSL